MLWIAPAAADPVAPVSLLPALDVYVDALAAGHAAATVCAGAWPASKADEAGWGQAKAIFIASLWANDFPIDFVRTVTQRLDAAPPPTKPDCVHPDPALAGEFGWPSEVGWVAVVEAGLKGMDLSVVADPVPPATWATIKGMIAKVLPDETRLLDCVAVSYPETLPAMVHDWDAMIVKIGGSLVAAGLPRDEVNATLSGAEANRLWHRAATDTEAELRDSCSKDPIWQKRLNTMDFLGLEGEVEKLLPQPQESTQ
ncbi:MAG: hypothetical protein P4M09_30350 [Devosia sp.]|nr:hypothetical protein [Devosia sp.]